MAKVWAKNRPCLKLRASRNGLNKDILSFILAIHICTEIQGIPHKFLSICVYVWVCMCEHVCWRTGEFTNLILFSYSSFSKYAHRHQLFVYSRNLLSFQLSNMFKVLHNIPFFFFPKGFFFFPIVDHFYSLYWICYSVISVLCLVFWPRDLSSLTRNPTCIPCIGRWNLNHWTAREVPPLSFIWKEVNYLFYFWLLWIFVALCGLSLVAASGGYSSLWFWGFLWWRLLLWAVVTQDQ